ncbi:MAG: oxygen-independent coproporphyrinogen III oxidase [Deltaproteobacteria bacterium RIFOXYA12_FULL_58_15]|nr:MAG: oxygen-independent coproporphyrinogen III oxidase [Deltaproteobacteria bacterium RIFOXYA12_FULL_58_15]
MSEINEHEIPRELIAKYDRPGPRYTSYPTAPEWTDFTAEDAAAAIEAARTDPRAISIYVHIPFCEQMCTFCGCNMVASKKRDRVPRYLTALKREIELVRGLTGPKKTIQLHFGGGTPTYLLPTELSDLVGVIWDAFPPADGVEAGIEIDPMVTTREHLAAAVDVGFRRLSMGVQDFGDDVQALVERNQPDSKSTEIFNVARELGFSSINIDLMYGLPGQTPAHLAHSAKRVFELGADRVAVFGYAHVPWLKPQQRKLEQHGIPGGDARWEMFNAARVALLDAGYQAIGMDHFAKQGDELAQAWRDRRLNRNFQGYTVLAPTHVLGLGVTAISDMGGAYVQNAKRLSTYQEKIEAGVLAAERGRRLSEDDLLRRQVINEIMCNLRVDYSAVEEAFSIEFAEYFAGPLAELDGFVADGLVNRRPEGLEVTERGRVFVRNVAMLFDAYLGKDSGVADKPRFSRTV